MLKVVKKDITTVTEGVIPHGVNCQGKMGSGVAKAIKEKWPSVYTQFIISPTGRDMLGKAICIEVRKNLFVFNCYTQEYYGYDGRRYASPEALRESLSEAFAFARLNDLDVYMPKIASDRGGLNWETEVKPIINELIAENDINVYVCEI